MRWARIFALAAVALLAFGASHSALAQTSGVVVGTVADAQGATVPGATITLISESRGTTQDTQTAGTGDFTFPSVLPDTYTVRVSVDGFKTLERRNIAVSPGDRVVIPTLAIELGTLAETVTVTGEAPLIQAQSGERSFTVTTEAVQNLPIANRNFGGLASLTPGVIGTTRIGSPGSTTNFQIDGVSTIDTGAGGQALQLNVEAIAEVRVISSGYQAEYGRNIGLQITGVTKSGTNQYRGSVYDIQRNSDWNSNSWVNAQNGDPKAVSKQQDWGYTLGGPIGKPGGDNRWFFFYGHEYRPRKTGGAINRFRVPTLLERQGDFSQSTDNNGALFNTIRDASTGLPCSAADTRGCFRDGGVLGRIPQNLLYPLGLNVLKQWPSPNVNGLNYNLETVAPEDNRLTHQPTVRVDWQQSSKLRFTTKYAGQRATVKTTPGSIPGFNDAINQFPFITVASGTVDYTWTPTTVVEATYGFYQADEQGSIMVSPLTNRDNIGLGNFPMLYPDAGIVEPGSYQEKVLQAANAPFYVNGRVHMAPTFTWGSRIGGGTPNLTPPSLQYNTGGFLDMVRTNNISVSMTRLMGRHTVKVGYQLDHSLKKQEQLGNPKLFQGRLNFGNDTNNPIDSGFGFANAALGVFTSYEQINALFEGNFIYDSHEWYVQDNWKVNNRLSLDYGLRITNQGPNYDTKLQASNFFVEKWQASAAPLLYRPGCAVATTPCPSASRVAINPATGASLGTNTQVAIGSLVPGSGDPYNGILQAGNGIAKTNYTWPTLGFAPRFGAAYDVSGTQRMVVRGGFGVFYDRLNGNTVYNQVGNPPVGISTNVRNGQLQTLGQSGLVTQTPSSMTVFYYDSKLPTSLQWNIGTQMTLPWASSLDISYVGSHAYNILGQNPDVNSPDLGVAYLAQNQDPTLSSTVPGGAALTTDLLRPYRGLGQITTTWGKNWNGYDSIQMSLNRRFRDGVQATLNYTRSLRTIGNTGAQLRLQHNPDGSFVVRDDQETLDDLMRNTGNRPHVIRANFVWELPGISTDSTASKVAGAIINDWQLSGVFTGTSGARYDATYTYNANGGNVNLTGSPSYAARIKVVGDPGSGCSDNRYALFDTSAFAGPSYNSLGLESGSSLLGGCFERIMDLSIARNIRLGGGRQVQLRVDMFNAFNTVVLGAAANASSDNRVTQLQLNSPTDPTIRNNQFLADGTLNPARVKPRDAGFGAARGALDMRTVQLQLRFQF
ncbi:MAG: carboxypeptidase regulatory-like domain-containing protein [Vicinamibacterales bacterium]